jgi:hypothetical protein
VCSERVIDSAPRRADASHAARSHRLHSSTIAMPPVLTGPQTVLALKAGRAFRRGETTWVDASPEKGALCVDREDDMLRLLWKNRVSGSTDEVRVARNMCFRRF